LDDAGRLPAADADRDESRFFERTAHLRTRNKGTCRDCESSSAAQDTKHFHYGATAATREGEVREMLADDLIEGLVGKRTSCDVSLDVGLSNLGNV
jgi:hypothetical protein